METKKSSWDGNVDNMYVGLECRYRLIGNFQGETHKDHIFNCRIKYILNTVENCGREWVIERSSGDEQVVRDYGSQIVEFFPQPTADEMNRERLMDWLDRSTQVDLTHPKSTILINELIDLGVIQIPERKE